jgi:hypothetical protein
MAFRRKIKKRRSEARFFKAKVLNTLIWVSGASIAITIAFGIISSTTDIFKPSKGELIVAQAASQSGQRSLNTPESMTALSLTEILQKIATCESDNNPRARNPYSSAKGLLQILDGTWYTFQCKGNVFNAYDNFQCGLKIAQLSGLHHWNASRSCWNPIAEM